MQSKLYYRICILGALLIIIGSAVVLSSSTGYAISKSGNPAYYFVKHLLWLVLGVLGIFIISKLGLKRIERNVLLFFLFSLLLLPIPVLTGNLRWIKIGPFSFQPAELIKFTFIMYMADYLKRKGKDIDKLKTLVIPAIFLALITLILQFQKDLGTFVVIFFTFFLLLFLAGLPKKYLFSITGIGIFLMVVFVVIFPYRMERIKIFLNPSLDPQGKGYQINQAKLALGSGGLLGEGIGDGTQKLKYLPEAHKDYVFAIIGEESGFLGTSIILFLFGTLIFSGLQVAQRAENKFEKFMAAGISGLFGFQFILHASVVLNLIPSKGTTLPFCSVGGSSLLINILALGVLLEIARNTCFLGPLEEFEKSVVLNF